MAYNDQYAGHQEYNPYSNSQPHASYEEPHAAAYDNYGPGYQDTSYPATGFNKTRDADELSSGFDRGEFGSPRGENGYQRRAQNIRQYRREFRNDNLWTKGGRGSCIGRFFCCTLMIAVFMIVSIVLALALYQIQLETSGIIVPLEVNISVNNPNYFSVDLKKLTYPLDGNDTAIGNGSTSDITFHSHSNTSFTFPFEIDYQFSTDPNYAILLDMASKCGILGGSQSDLTIDYSIKVDLKIIFISVSPTITNSFSIACPFDESELEDFIKSLGLSSILGSL
ncbi:hypothetical protein F5876DRAFT_86085 [Lentinula aff. lateritia]|uniref:Uncharacterized protein n=1 Tax=Lentinula aff. lateritia TaxID=2804960 RepID=A0ACC1UDF6_9AGAR|nr:hypothetical protein F5876DRAFT_86085 [Lentinula aff. lateritia]